MASPSLAQNRTIVVPRGVRRAFQVDALFEVAVGSVLMGNPLFGPTLGVNAFLVASVGILCLVAAVFLGGAGLGRGTLRSRLPMVASCNAVLGLLMIVWGLIGAGGRVFLALIGIGLLVVAFVQALAIRKPQGPDTQRRATPDELRAALFGKSKPDGD